MIIFNQKLRCDGLDNKWLFFDFQPEISVSQKKSDTDASITENDDIAPPMKDHKTDDETEPEMSTKQPTPKMYWMTKALPSQTAWNLQKSYLPSEMTRKDHILHHLEACQKRYPKEHTPGTPEKSIVCIFLIYS